MPIIPVFERQKQEGQGFMAILSYVTNFKAILGYMTNFELNRAI